MPGNQFVVGLSAARVQFWPKLKQHAIDVAILDDESCGDGGPDPLALEDAQAQVEDAVMDGADFEAELEGDVGDVDVPPPPMPPPDQETGGRGRIIKCAIGPHTITYYPHDQRFQAVCNHVGHLPLHKCRLTRYLPRPGADPESKGRPCGLMAAWLTMDLAINSIIDRHGHQDPFLILSISRAERIAGRQLLKSLPGGLALLNCERPIGDGEPEEPLENP